MSKQHRVEVDNDRGRTWMAVCSCRAQSKLFTRRSEAEDWEFAHLRTVERVKTHLAGQPTLATTYAYYREMEADPAVSDRERRQWKILADGLEHRLGVRTQTDSMFEEAQ